MLITTPRRLPPDRDVPTLQVFNPSVFAVSKYAINTVVEPGEPIEYELRWVNLATPVSGTDFIDWLPFVGDGRTPATSHDGTYTLTSVSQTGGTQANTFKYTKFPSTSVSVPSDYDPTTINPAIQWCLATEFGVVTGCPAVARRGHRCAIRRWIDHDVQWVDPHPDDDHAWNRY